MFACSIRQTSCNLQKIRRAKCADYKPRQPEINANELWTIRSLLCHCHSCQMLSILLHTGHVLIENRLLVESNACHIAERIDFWILQNMHFHIRAVPPHIWYVLWINDKWPFHLAMELEWANLRKWISATTSWTNASCISPNPGWQYVSWVQSISDSPSIPRQWIAIDTFLASSGKASSHLNTSISIQLRHRTIDWEIAMASNWIEFPERQPNEFCSTKFHNISTHRSAHSIGSATLCPCDRNRWKTLPFCNFCRWQSERIHGNIRSSLWPDKFHRIQAIGPAIGIRLRRNRPNHRTDHTNACRPMHNLVAQRRFCYSQLPWWRRWCRWVLILPVILSVSREEFHRFPSIRRHRLEYLSVHSSWLNSQRNQAHHCIQTKWM